MLMKFFRLLDILQPLMFRCPAKQVSTSGTHADLQRRYLSHMPTCSPTDLPALADDCSVPDDTHT